VAKNAKNACKDTDAKPSKEIAEANSSSNDEATIVASKITGKASFRTGLIVGILALAGVLFTSCGNIISSVLTNADKLITILKKDNHEIEQARIEAYLVERENNSVKGLDRSIEFLESLKTNIENRNIKAKVKQKNKRILDQAVLLIKSKKPLVVEKYKTLRYQTKNHSILESRITEREIEEILHDLQRDIDKSFETGELKGLQGFTLDGAESRPVLFEDPASRWRLSTIRHLRGRKLSKYPRFRKKQLSKLQTKIRNTLPAQQKEFNKEFKGLDDPRVFGDLFKRN
jgi:hypothetical protein